MLLCLVVLLLSARVLVYISYTWYVRGVCVFFFFKQKTAYEMRISDWSSDVCSSDLPQLGLAKRSTHSADRAGQAVPIATADTRETKPNDDDTTDLTSGSPYKGDRFRG